MKYLQKVKCKAKLKREHYRKGDRHSYWGTGRRWVRVESEFKGIVIGIRNLQNGTVHYEENTWFQPDEIFTAYLVSISFHKNPVYCLSEDLK